MAELRTDLKNIKEKQDRFDLKNDAAHEKISISIKDGLNQIHLTLLAQEGRFAKKWVEKFLLWAGGIIGTAILSGLIWLVVQSTRHLT